MTAKEFWNLPDDHLRHELVRGKLATLPLAGAQHGMVVAKLGSLLSEYLAANKQSDLGHLLVGPVGFWIEKNPDTVLSVDIAFVSAARIPSTGIPETWFEFAPDLAIEVVDSTDLAYDIEEQVQAWLDAGSRLVWVAYPGTQTVVIHAPNRPPRILYGNDELSGEGVIPGFVCTVGEIFER